MGISDTMINRRKKNTNFVGETKTKSEQPIQQPTQQPTQQPIAQPQQVPQTQPVQQPTQPTAQQPRFYEASTQQQQVQQQPVQQQPVQQTQPTIAHTRYNDPVLDSMTNEQRNIWEEADRGKGKRYFREKYGNDWKDYWNIALWKDEWEDNFQRRNPRELNWEELDDLMREAGVGRIDARIPEFQEEETTGNIRAIYERYAAGERLTAEEFDLLERAGYRLGEFDYRGEDRVPINEPIQPVPDPTDNDIISNDVPGTYRDDQGNLTPIENEPIVLGGGSDNRNDQGQIVLQPGETEETPSWYSWENIKAQIDKSWNDLPWYNPGSLKMTVGLGTTLIALITGGAAAGGITGALRGGTVLPGAIVKNSAGVIVRQGSTAASKVAANSVNVAKSNGVIMSVLSKLGKPQYIAPAIMAAIGTYPFAEWSRIEANQQMSMATGAALDEIKFNNNWEPWERLQEIKETFYDRSVWDNIARFIPGANLATGFLKEYESFRAQQMVNDAVADFEMERLKKGETEDDLVRREGEAKVQQEQDITDYYTKEREKLLSFELEVERQKQELLTESAEDRSENYNNQRRKQLEWEAEYWKQVRESRRREEEVERLKIAEFWLQYHIAKEKIRGQLAGSGLSFAFLGAEREKYFQELLKGESN